MVFLRESPSQAQEETVSVPAFGSSCRLCVILLCVVGGAARSLEPAGCGTDSVVLRLRRAAVTGYAPPACEPVNANRPSGAPSGAVAHWQIGASATIATVREIADGTIGGAQSNLGTLAVPRCDTCTHFVEVLARPEKLCLHHTQPQAGGSKRLCVARSSLAPGLAPAGGGLGLYWHSTTGSILLQSLEFSTVHVIPSSILLQKDYARYNVAREAIADTDYGRFGDVPTESPLTLRVESLLDVSGSSSSSCFLGEELVSQLRINAAAQQNRTSLKAMVDLREARQSVCVDWTGCADNRTGETCFTVTPRWTKLPVTTTPSTDATLGVCTEGDLCVVTVTVTRVTEQGCSIFSLDQAHW